MSDESKEDAAKGETALDRFFSHAQKWSVRIVTIGSAIAFLGGAIAFLYPIVCGFVWTWREALFRTSIAVLPPVLNLVVIWRFTRFLLTSSIESLDWKKLARFIQLISAGILFHTLAIVFCVMIAVSSFVQAKSTFSFDTIGWLLITTSLIVDGTTLIVMPLLGLCVVGMLAVEQIAKFNAILFPVKTEESPLVPANVESTGTVTPSAPNSGP